MLMEKNNDNSLDSLRNDSQNFVFYVGGDSVMKNAVDLIEHFGKTENLILRARGLSIPNAVAIANILTEKMLSGKSKIHKITVGSETPKEMGRMVSTIEIIISKN